MSKALLLSLGHNSSAIYTDGTDVIGYEQERLDRIKSSSSPPLEAISEIARYKDLKNVPVFVTHWFDGFKNLAHNKYTAGLGDLLIDHPVKTHDKSFTHHDAHAWSSLSFFRHYYDDTHGYDMAWPKYPVHYIVADGFGNNQEVFSIYKSDYKGKTLEKIHSVHGYGSSLGLMYQYATKFCGMKMNQDEYKFLGYESKIEYCLSNDQIHLISSETQTIVEMLLVKFDEANKDVAILDDLINLNALHGVQLWWEVVFGGLLSRLGIWDKTSNFARIAIAYFVQNIIERCLLRVVAAFNIRNLVLSGGIFYNVKLNHVLAEAVRGKFCVVPLAGDQGASIGFYEKFVGHFNWDTLAIGNRKIDPRIMHNPSNNIWGFEDKADLLSFLFEKISSGQICNLVTDKMEFGPRALGNTSSLFLPWSHLADANNKMNARNEVMPFAPMIAEESMETVFKDTYNKVVGSNRFMILTHDYMDDPKPFTAGVYHKYPLIPVYSGRPQVLSSKDLLHPLLLNLEKYSHGNLLTNTSYNYHGEPIVFRPSEILNTHRKQMENYNFSGRTLPKPNLVIYKSKESA